jgi:Mg2+-importing ATPase
MIIFGIHSSIFDIITFFVLLFILRVKESSFQTGWFVESVLCQLFILFIIRTHKNFFKSNPGKYLTLLSVLGLVLTIALPYTIVANIVGLVPIPLFNLVILLSIVAVYIITADILKVWFFKKYRSA